MTRKKKVRSKRFIDFDDGHDDFEDIRGVNQLENNNRTEGQNSSLESYLINETDIESRLENVQNESQDTQLLATQQKLSPHTEQPAGTGMSEQSNDNTENITEASDIEDNSDENNIVIAGSDTMINVSNTEIIDNSSEDDLSWIMDNPWYSVKARRAADGLKQFIFVCRICGKQCQRRANMDDHVRSHAGIKPFSCQICKGNFSRKQNLKSHLAKMHNLNEADVKCLLQEVDTPDPAINCREIRQYLKSYGVHDKVNKKKDMPSLGLKGTLEANEKHKLDTEIYCNSEEKQNISDNDTTQYEKFPQYSTETGKSFPSGETALSEKGFKLVEDYGEFICLAPKDGTPAKLYHCKTCNYECVRRYTMKTHTLIHTGVKRYFCEICDSDFTRNTSLKVHLTRAHSITGPELDEIIKKASETATPGVVATQSKYESKITDVLPQNYSEPISGGRDGGAGDLMDADENINKILDGERSAETYHDKRIDIPSMTDSNDDFKEVVMDYGNFTCVELMDKISHSKIYRCKVCSYECTRRYTMKTHVWTHTGYKRYCCTLCGNSFTRSTYFRFHLRKAHSLTGDELDSIVRSASGLSAFPSPYFRGENIMSSDDDTKHSTGESSETFQQNALAQLNQTLQFDEDSFIKTEQDDVKFTKITSDLNFKNDTEELNTDPVKDAMVINQNESSLQKTTVSDDNSKVDQMTVNQKADVGHLLEFDENEYLDIENLRCKKCEKVCSNKGNLKAHVRLHLNLRPFACPYCQKTFSKSSNMRFHVRRMHNKSSFSLDYSSDLFGKEDLYKTETPPKLTADNYMSHMTEKTSNISGNENIEQGLLRKASKAGALLSKMSKADTSLQETHCSITDKEDTLIANINFETMAEELWGYNGKPGSTSIEDNQEEKKPDGNELKDSLTKQVKNPYKFMKQENLNKTSMYPVNLAYENSAHLLTKDEYGNFTHINKDDCGGLSYSKNGQEGITCLTNGNIHEDVANLRKRKRDGRLLNFTDANLIGGGQAVGNETSSYSVETVAVNNIPQQANSVEREQNLSNNRSIFTHEASLADPYFVKLKLLMDEQNLQCRDCFKMFSNKWSLKAHVKAIHLQGKQFVCSVCNKMFNFKCNLERHYTVHNPNWVKEKAPLEPFQQSKDEIFSHKKDFSTELHESDKGDSSNSESFSDIASPDKLSAKSMSKTMVSASPDNPPEDLETSKNISSAGDEMTQLEVESLMDLDTYQCKKCLRQFANKWSLKAHVKAIHIQSRKYVCPVCQKSFNHKCNLDRHFAIHPDYTPKQEPDPNESTEFQCPYCKKCYANQWSMKAHIKAIHIYARQYACTICEKSFNHKCNLDRHLAVHVSDGTNRTDNENGSVSENVPLDLSRDFAGKDEYLNQPSELSEISPIPLVDNDALSFKERILMDVDKLKCIKCGKICSNKANLKTHVHLHLNLNHVCFICQKSFNSKKNLKRHYRTHSAENSNGSVFDNTLDDSGEKFIPGVMNVAADESVMIKTEEELPSVGSEEDGPVFCGLCGEKFDNRNSLHEHFKTHEEF